MKVNSEQLTVNNEELRVKNANKFYFSLSFILCSLFFVSGCNNIFDPPVSQTPGTGTGYFSLVFGDSEARTIMPTLNASWFALYELTFTKQADSSLPTVVYKTHEDLSDPVELEIGTWDLTIGAYRYNSDTSPADTQSIPDIEINEYTTVTRGVTFVVPVDSTGIGEGTFTWVIKAQGTISKIEMDITELDRTPVWSSSNTGSWTGSKELPAGYYRVMIRLLNSGGQIVNERSEYLHVHAGKTSHYDEMFSDRDTVIVRVTSNANSGIGSLRAAVEYFVAPPDGYIIVVDPGVKTITLEGRLVVDRNLTIEGNGVTITRAGTWTEIDNNSEFLYIFASVTVNISRVHFKDGRSTDFGAAIHNMGNLTLESCIFSGNWASGNLAYGGAIYSESTTNILGCTFYNNNSAHDKDGRGGAVFFDDANSGKVLTLEGNLFYRNDAGVGKGPNVYRASGIIISGGNNVSDGILVFDPNSAYVPNPGDTVISSMPISPVSFELLSSSGAAGVIDNIPAGYPITDFYGNAVIAPAAAGAAQSQDSGTLFLFNVIYEFARGQVSISADMYEGTYVTGGPATLSATAMPGYRFSHWLGNGQRKDGTPLTINVDSDTTVDAVFGNHIKITVSGDSGSDSLRYALNNAEEGDFIEVDSELVPVITLSNYNLNVDTSITIEGNGVILKPGSPWEASYSNPILFVNPDVIVTISRVHFKDGRSIDYGSAISNRGNLTLESCIFSGNRTEQDIYTPFGGAIYNIGIMNILGCTFYNNSTNGRGGVVYTREDDGKPCELYLMGNLFWGNTAEYGNSNVVYNDYGIVTSLWYNVVDVAIGTGDSQSGWDSGITGDATFTGVGFTDNATLPFVDTINFVPLATGTLRTHIPGTLPSDLSNADFPTTDFNGNPRKHTLGQSGAPGAVNWQ